MNIIENLNKSATFNQKSSQIRELILVTLEMLNEFGIPMDATPRRLERMAVAFLACGDVKELEGLSNIKDANSEYSLKTREIISYINEHFEENVSSGSYDDIRRKDLKLLTTAEIILRSSPNAATNDSTRGYCVSPFYADLVKKYQFPNWKELVREKLEGVEPLELKLQRKRALKKVEVKLPSGKDLEFSAGEHNDLQKAIIEKFLPRYGYNSQVLYIGDTSDKYLHLDQNKLDQLGLFKIAHEELPDVIAYSSEKNWIYFIEAVHSSGPISELRLIQLQNLSRECSADVIYVTAFLDRPKFRQFMTEIAWETEVWIADNPDHLVHFNGDKFLGPYR